MPKTWVYSDPHFYHDNICKFTRNDGSPLRPWDDAREMTEDMIEMYNELVNDEDRVYILGDVAFSPAKMRKYFDLFDDVRGYVVKKGFIMSHIPIHEGSLSRWKLNIHGHLHANFVTKPYVNGSDTPKDGSYDSLNETVADNRYYCACVEHTDYKPKLLDEILHERGLR